MTEFTGGVTPGFTVNADPEGITAGGDGNIWFAEGAGRLGRVNPNGTVSEFPLASEGKARGIAGDRFGNIWFTEPSGNPRRVGRRSSNGTFTELTAGTTPGFTGTTGTVEDITVGPDGRAWFTDSAGRVGRVNSNDTVTELTAGVTPGFNAGALPWGITTGPDGNIWFTDVNGSNGGVARVNPNGTVTEFTAGVTPGMSQGYTEEVIAGPDGNIWYARNGGSHPGVGRLNPNGTATEFTLGVTPGFASYTYPEGITVGCDANIWFSEFGSPGGVGRLNPNGTVTEYVGGVTPGLSADAHARRVTAGPDGNIWFAESAGRIARLTPPPGAETGTASASWRFAGLQGTVRPCGQPTVYSFEYGTGTSYGNATTPVGVPGVRFPVTAAAPTTRLAPNTTYHYRLDATNHSGTTYGADHTFTTAPSPLVSVFGVNPPVFAAQSRGPSATFVRKSTNKVHRGTTVRFNLNEAATVRFTVTKQSQGRMVKQGKKKVCVKPTRKNRKHKSCKRRVTLKGSFTIKGVAGKNKFHFTGRLNGKKLPPGRYRLMATPILGGQASKSTSTAIRIVR